MSKSVPAALGWLAITLELLALIDIVVVFGAQDRSWMSHHLAESMMWGALGAVIVAVLLAMPGRREQPAKIALVIALLMLAGFLFQLLSHS